MFCTYSKNWYIQLLPKLTSLNKQFTELFHGMKLASIYDPEFMQHTETSVAHFYRILKKISSPYSIPKNQFLLPTYILKCPV